MEELKDLEKRIWNKYSEYISKIEYDLFPTKDITIYNFKITFKKPISEGTLKGNDNILFSDILSRLNVKEIERLVNKIMENA